MSQSPPNGALATVVGKISNNATWNESISIVVNTSPATGFSSDAWSMTFRCNEDDTAAKVTLTTASSTLVYTEASTISTLQINATPDDLSSLVGDYVCDLSSESTTSVITHWAHGRVTFLNGPVR